MLVTNDTCRFVILLEPSLKHRSILFKASRETWGQFIYKTIVFLFPPLLIIESVRYTFSRLEIDRVRWKRLDGDRQLCRLLQLWWRMDQNKHHKAHSCLLCASVCSLCSYLCIFRTWSSVRVKVQIQPEVKFREPDDLVRLHDLRGQRAMVEKETGSGGWWGGSYDVVIKFKSVMFIQMRIQTHMLLSLYLFIYLNPF